MALNEYKKKRNFKETDEPDTGEKQSDGKLKFVIQRHHASHLHYDFRLEMDGVLKSWAVPKGPSLNPKDKRLAMMVEDHPYDYRTFEGVIPEGNYGAGVVTIFDEGTYEALDGKDDKELKKGLNSGNLKFKLHGKILNGEFALVKLKGNEDNSWLLIKHRDEFATDKIFNSETLVPESIKKKGLDHKKLAKAAKEKIIASKPETEEIPYKTMAAKLSDEVFNDKNWVYERMLDGYRTLAFTGKNVKLESGNGIDFTEKYTPIKKALSDLHVDAVLDGELVAEDKLGKGTFQEIQNYKSTNKDFKLKYYVFDLLALNGHDIRELELTKRKELLKALLVKFNNPAIIYTNHVLGDGKKLFEEAKAKGWEGIIAKDANSKYESDKQSGKWLKFKVQNSKEDNKMGESSPPASNHIKHSAEQPFTDELEETFGKKKLKLTNLNKLYWKKEGIKKGELIAYYRSISEYILPYLKDRPLSLNRHPNGIDEPGFFQKDLDTDQIPSWIKSHPIHSESNNKEIDYLICNDLPTLLWMANLGCIEINPWLSTYKKIENPVFAVMDLDPNDVEDFSEVVKVAQTTKYILEQMGVNPYIKTSGSRGLHIFIHVAEKYDYEVVKNFIQYLGVLVHQQHPESTSLERSPSKRKRKIYLDFLQNRRGQTIAAPYSARPKPGATVSTPLEWTEVSESLDIKQFTIFNTLERIEKKGDLWKDITKERTDLKNALEKLK